MIEAVLLGLQSLRKNQRAPARSIKSERLPSVTTTSLEISPAPLAFGFSALADAVGRILSRFPVRDSLLAGAMVIAASVVVYADEHVQDWIPDVLTFPEDAEVVTDRAIGSSVRLFSISTGADVDALLADWEGSLTENGYPVTQEAGDLLDRSIEFTGPGITNAKIIVAPVTEDGRRVIEFDATLN